MKVKLGYFHPFISTVTVKYFLLVNSYGSLSGVVVNLIYTYSRPMNILMSVTLTQIRKSLMYTDIYMYICIIYIYTHI